LRSDLSVPGSAVVAMTTLADTDEHIHLAFVAATAANSTIILLYLLRRSKTYRVHKQLNVPLCLVGVARTAAAQLMVITASGELLMARASCVGSSTLTLCTRTGQHQPNGHRVCPKGLRTDGDRKPRGWTHCRV
jgi:hypothetical protein